MATVKGNVQDRVKTWIKIRDFKLKLKETKFKKIKIGLFKMVYIIFSAIICALLAKPKKKNVLVSETKLSKEEVETLIEVNKIKLKLVDIEQDTLKSNSIKDLDKILDSTKDIETRIIKLNLTTPQEREFKKNLDKIKETVEVKRIEQINKFLEIEEPQNVEKIEEVKTIEEIRIEITEIDKKIEQEEDKSLINDLKINLTNLKEIQIVKEESANELVEEIDKLITKCDDKINKEETKINSITNIKEELEEINEIIKTNINFVVEEAPLIKITEDLKIETINIEKPLKKVEESEIKIPIKEETKDEANFYMSIVDINFLELKHEKDIEKLNYEIEDLKIYKNNKPNFIKKINEFLKQTVTFGIIFYPFTFLQNKWISKLGSAIFVHNRVKSLNNTMKDIDHKDGIIDIKIVKKIKSKTENILKLNEVLDNTYFELLEIKNRIIEQYKDSEELGELLFQITKIEDNISLNKIKISEELNKNKSIENKIKKLVK